MSDDVLGRPAEELSDEELELQGTQAHATRNWVFLHGSAEQFARHTTRMVELENEYLRRFPKRTWQGSGGAPSDSQGAALGPVDQTGDPARTLLIRIRKQGGRMHKLEAHQAAREAGLERSGLAALYKADPPLLATEGEYRVITEAGLARIGSTT